MKIFIARQKNLIILSDNLKDDWKNECGDEPSNKIDWTYNISDS